MKRKIDQFWDEYAEVFASQILQNKLLSRFTQNTAVTGAYAESWIRNLVHEMLPNHKISTGCIIHAADRALDRIDQSQMDLIIWDPSELPAIFEHGDFALVPSFSVRGVIEIKRSCSNLKKFQAQLEKQRNEMPEKCKKYILGVLLQHKSKNPFPVQASPIWCAEIKPSTPPPITRILSGNGNVDKEGIFSLIYLLSQISRQ